MLLLLGKGFFMGIFLASYQIGAETLFLNTLGEEYLDKAFFVAGFLGILSTTVFVKLQQRVKFSSLIVSNVFLTFLFIGFLRFAFTFTDYDTNAELQYLPFILFVMIGPILAITLIGFWGIFGRVFNLKQSKRIIGGIDTGQLSATILAFFSIPLLDSIGLIDQTYDLLFMAAIAAFGMVFFTIWIVKDYNLDKATKVAEGEQKQKISFMRIFADPYLRMMAFFVIFSMAAGVFMNYTFYSATEIMFPKTEEEKLRDFLSFFNGTVMIVSFLIQSFVNDVIIQRFGLRVALMVMPLVLLLFVIGAVISGYMFGYEVRNDQFLFFFLFTALGKLFTASLKDALENPAFKLFFLPLDVKIRFDVQTRIEGVINEFATLLAGAIQIGLGLLAYFELIHYTFFIIAMAGMVIYLANNLFAQYKRTLKNTLEIQKSQLTDSNLRRDINIINALRTEALSSDPDEVINALKILEKVDPIQLEPVLVSSLQSDRKKVRKYAYVKLNDLLCYEQLEGLKREAKYEDDPKLKELADKVIKNLEKADQYELKPSAIKHLVRSLDAADRVLAARLLSKLTQDRFVPYLVELARDINQDVRIAAMVSAGKLRRPEFWPLFVENLHLATYGNIAMAGLVEAGEDALHLVDTAFYKTNQYPVTMLRVIQVIGRVGGYRATELLWKKIDFPNKKIVSELLLTLSYLGFEARDFHAARIKIFIDAILGDITWNLKALEEIPTKRYEDKLIREAIAQENKENYDNIFMLLSMIYDPQSIMLVRENIEVGTSESVAFAIEMLDIFVDDELKPKLFPALDDEKIENKLKKLHDHYAPEYFKSYEDLLLQIINRDYNHLNRWTKVLAIHRTGLMPDSHIGMDLIANIFNPDPLILETVASVIYKKDKNAYQHHTRRIKSELKKELDKNIIPPVFQGTDENFHQKMLLMEKTLFLKGLRSFEKVKGLTLTEIAQCIDEVKIQANVSIIEQGDPGSNPLYIILKGRVKVVDEDGKEEILSKGNIIGEKIILSSIQFDFTATTLEECILLIIRKEEFFDLITRNVDLVYTQLEIMGGKLNYAEEDEEETFSVFGD